MADKIDTHIRGLDKELWTLARIAAIREGMTIAAWVNSAISEKLKGEVSK